MGTGVFPGKVGEEASLGGLKQAAFVDKGLMLSGDHPPRSSAGRQRPGHHGEMVGGVPVAQVQTDPQPLQAPDGAAGEGTGQNPPFLGGAAGTDGHFRGFPVFGGAVKGQGAGLADMAGQAAYAVQNILVTVHHVPVQQGEGGALGQAQHSGELVKELVQRDHQLQKGCGGGIGFGQWG